jgi:hypothetical protein
LKNQTIIKGLLAALMLILFAFSITPKIVLHDFVANHKDTPLKSNFGENAQLNVAGYHCSCDNLVVESPFTDTKVKSPVTRVAVFPQLNLIYHGHFYAGHNFYIELRGPPANLAA